MKKFTSQSQKIGEIGENIAERFLVKRGYSIIERNYTKKWGEIDIVAKIGKIIHFVEVKSVSYETNSRPEENMHSWKQKRLIRAVETYIMEKGIDTEWQFDLVCVYLDMNNKKARVEILENIVLE